MLTIIVKNEKRNYSAVYMKRSRNFGSNFSDFFFQQVFGILVSNRPAFYEHNREMPGGAFQTWRGLKGGQENKWKLRD